MYSKKFYSFDPRNSRTEQHGNPHSTRGSSQATFTKSPYEPVEGKIDRENHITKEDTRSISENVTKSVVTRNVIDRRSSSSYTTREDIKAIKTRGLKGIRNTFKGASKFQQELVMLMKIQRTVLSVHLTLLTQGMKTSAKLQLPIHQPRMAKTLYLLSIDPMVANKHLTTKNDRRKKTEFRQVPLNTQNGHLNWN